MFNKSIRYISQQAATENTPNLTIFQFNTCFMSLDTLTTFTLQTAVFKLSYHV